MPIAHKTHQCKRVHMTSTAAELRFVHCSGVCLFIRDLSASAKHSAQHLYLMYFHRRKTCLMYPSLWYPSSFIVSIPAAVQKFSILLVSRGMRDSGLLNCVRMNTNSILSNTQSFRTGVNRNSIIIQILWMSLLNQQKFPDASSDERYSDLQLEKDGQKCTSIHGDLEHSARDRVVNEFREGKTRVLIATDVLSRGFDVQQASTPDWLTMSLMNRQYHTTITCNWMLQLDGMTPL